MTELEQKLRDIADEKDLKILPENIKKDVEIFDVTGTYEGSGSSGEGVKLFTTEEEMQADETAQEGDLAIVYRSEIQNMTADTQTQYITFPETVVLPEAFTGDAYCMLRAIDDSVMFDGNIMLNTNMFRFDGFTDSGMIRVSYTSNDGITYTREEFMGDSGDLSNPVDLGVEIHCEMQEEWNDNFGYFMQIGGNIFEGLFEYGEYHKDIVLDMKYNFRIEDNVVICDTISQDISSVFEKIININAYEGSMRLLGTSYSNNVPTRIIGVSGGNSTYVKYNNKIYLAAFYSSTEPASTTYSVKVYDLVNNTYTDEKVNTFNILYDGKYYQLVNEPVEDISTIFYGNVGINNKTFSIPGASVFMNVIEADNSGRIDVSLSYTSFYQYNITQTQLSLSEANQLLPGKIAYGKNGVVTGDGSIWSSIPSSVILKDILKLNDFYNNGSTSLFKNIFETVGNIENNKEVTYLKRDSSGEYLVLTVNDVITSKTYDNYYTGTPIMKLNDGLRCTDYYPYGFIIRNIDDTEPLFTCSTQSKILKLKDNYLYYISLVDNAYKLLKLNTDNYEITEISTLLANADAQVYISFNGDYKYAFISICGGQNNFPGRRAILFNFDTEELVDVLNVSYKCYSFAIRYKDKIYFEYKLGSSSNSGIDLLSINLSDGSITKLLTNATSASFANVTDYTDLESNEAIGEDENYVYLNLYKRLNKATGIITRDMTPVINDLDLSASNLHLKKYVNETYYATAGSNTYLCLCNIQINDTTVTITGKKYYLGNQAYISIENELMDISILDKTIIGDICKLQSNEGIYLECTGYTYSLSSSIDYDLAVVNGSTDTGFINQVIISDNTLSQTEYDIALDTTKQILGEEV